MMMRLAARAHRPRAILAYTPGSGLGGLRAPLDVPVVRASELVDRSEISDVARRTLHAVEGLFHAPARECFPIVNGVHLGELNRLALLGALTIVETLTAAMRTMEAADGVRNWILIGHERQLLSALAWQARERGRAATVWRSRFGERLRDAYGMVRRSTAPGGSLPHDWDVEPADLMMISWTRPMDEMFVAVEDRLAASTGVRSLRVHFGDDIGRAAPSRRGVALLRAPAAERFGNLAVPAAAMELGACGLSEMRVVEMDNGNFLRHHISRMERRYSSQAAFIDAADRLLRQVKPRVLVVGNDRWWIGQSMVQLARQLGIRTLCLQDGVSSDLAVWRWCSAERVMTNGSHLRDLLLSEGVDARRIEVTGQPRYDNLGSYAGAVATKEARVRLALADTDLVVLFPTQYDQDEGYVERVVTACLEEPRVRLLLRPHPSGSTEVHRRLCNRFPTRVSLHREEPINELIAACDLLVVESSTTALEAAMVGKLVVIVNEHGAPPHDHVAFLDPITVSSASSIPEIIRAFLGGELRADQMKGRSAFERFCGLADGQSATRVMNCILAELAPA